VQCDDDFLMMLKSLQQARPGDVLVVDTRGSRRAVVGELFSMEAQRRGLAGIVVDGAVRDTEKVRSFSIPVYSRSITPVSGTVTKILESQLSIHCGGVTVNPGDILVGDDDGIVVASQEELEPLLPVAAGIQQAEEAALERMRKGESLLDMVNFDEHYANVQAKKESRLKFG
jgi:regulator of RNase E activity RraA